MGNTLYIECNAGISGDMTVAALLDLGADREVLEKVLHSIPVKGFEVKISRVKKAGIDCMDFAVKLEEQLENHDHDMAYLHGHSTHDQSVHPGRDHIHEEMHDGHSSHGHRKLQEVFTILNKTDMTDGARRTARRIFGILAEAEAKAHGLSVDEVHFHEVGAIDSIVDITAAAVCLDNLEIEEVIVPKICEGQGTIRCAHGILPIPVPAVANIMEKYELPMEFIGLEGEFVTPTGAAIVAAVRTSGRFDGSFKIQKTGIGAGKRSYERPSMLRMMLIEEVLSGTGNFSGARDVSVIENCEQRDLIYKLETNVDDCTGEALGYVMERLLEAGARDVYYSPVYMKKNRPAWQLNVLCDKDEIETMEQIIFLETTTIGIRRIPYERTILPRELKKISTKYGEVQVKVCKIGEKKRCYPEHESISKISKEQNLSYQEVYREVLKEAQKKQG